jgi:putative MATE family efflux protein
VSTASDKDTKNNEQQVNRLGTAKVTKLMTEFAIPAIIGLVVNGLYNIVDSIFLGHALGEVGLSTATAAMPIMIFSMAMGMLIGAGGNALAALKLGEGKHGETERVLSVSFTLILIFAVVITILVNLFMDQVLYITGLNESMEIWEPSHMFIRIISFGFILQFFGMGFNNFMRTAGDPNRALYTMVIGTVVCIVLNFLFVMVLGWGIAGSAWATVIGQGVSAVLVFWYFVLSPKAPFKIRWSLMPLTKRLVLNILSLGSASFVLQISNAVINVLLNHQLIELGAMTDIGSQGALAAIGVVQRIAMFTFFPIMGVAIACQPMFGYNYGARNYQRVKTIFKVGFVWVAIIGVFFWLMVHIFPSQIVYIFGVSDNSLNDFTIIVLQVQMFLIPLVGLQLMAANYYQSTGQPLKCMFLSLTRQLLYLIPLLYLLPHFITFIGTFFGLQLGPLDGVYYSYPVADALSGVTATLFMLVEFRRLNVKIAKQSSRS